MTFPCEIIEKILINCDGRSLFCARKVSRQWCEVVDYLSKKTLIWKWCCLEEIPKQEMTQYLNYYSEGDNWFFIYKNWLTWHNIPDVRMDLVLSPAEIPRITCIDVFENYIAVGSEDGRVRTFDLYWKPVGVTRHQAEKVSKVTFFCSDRSDGERVLKIVIAYPKSLVIDDLCSDSGLNHLILEDVVNHSIFRDYICYQKQGGRLTIERLNNTNNGRLLEATWFTRVYSPKNITCINMWSGICTVLVSNDVRKVDYDSKNIVPISTFFQKCLLNFSSLPNSVTSPVQHILRDDLIVVLYRADNAADKEYMEVIMLEGGPKYVKKLFSTSEVLQATITCICLFGNTLVLGLDNGIIYFYHVPSWKHFAIQNYQKKLIIGKHPINNIVARETKDKRVFYVTSSFNIHEVIGLSVTLL